MFRPGQLVVTPSSATMRGGDTQTFTAKLNGAPVAVNWSVNGVAGGNASTGMISAAGVYTAPEFPPSPNVVTIGATSTADSSKTASRIVTLNNPVPQIASVSPTSIPVGAFNLTVTGAHFASGATISFGSATLTATRVSSTQLTATGTATSGQVGNISITVNNPGSRAGFFRNDDRADHRQQRDQRASHAGDGDAARWATSVLQRDGDRARRIRA